MWHVSIGTSVALPKSMLRKWAQEALTGAGDSARGEWQEFNGRFYHLRRRLSELEEAVIGPAIDIRGTAEATRRLATVRRWVPPGWTE